LPIPVTGMKGRRAPYLRPRLVGWFVPYAYRVNDTGEAWRVLWRKFEERAEADVNCKEWRTMLRPRDDVVLRERYWVNRR